MVLEEYAVTNPGAGETLAETARYVNGRGIDERICMERNGMAAVVGVGTNADFQRFYYYTDALGSVRAVTWVQGGTSTEQLVERVDYDVYGKATVTNWGADRVFGNGDDATSSTSLVGNPCLFTGQRYDPETGNYYYRMRYYSPATGRFLSQDPAGYVDGANMYQYCGSNPLNFTDPMGLNRGNTKGLTGTAKPNDDPGISDYLGALWKRSPLSSWHNAANLIGPVQVGRMIYGGVQNTLNGHPEDNIIAVSMVKTLINSPDHYIDAKTKVGKASVVLDVTETLASVVMLGEAVNTAAAADEIAANSKVNQAIEDAKQAAVDNAAETQKIDQAQKASHPPPIAGSQKCLYRGVNQNNPYHYDNALKGNQYPLGDVRDSVAHHEGVTTNSAYTSWTPDPSVAYDHAIGNPPFGPPANPSSGVILEAKIDNSRITKPPQDLYGESEHLVDGPVEGAKVKPVNRN